MRMKTILAVLLAAAVMAACGTPTDQKSESVPDDPPEVETTTSVPDDPPEVTVQQIAAAIPGVCLVALDAADAVFSTTADILVASSTAWLLSQEMVEAMVAFDTDRMSELDDEMTEHASARERDGDNDILALHMDGYGVAGDECQIAAETSEACLDALDAADATISTAADYFAESVDMSRAIEEMTAALVVFDTAALDELIAVQAEQQVVRDRADDILAEYLDVYVVAAAECRES